MIDPLVTPAWLEAELGAADLVILDASLFLPAHGRDARAGFEAGHIPSAAFMDLAAFSPLPAPDRLRAMLAELGVKKRNRVMVYDDSPLRSAARGWWLLAHAGVDAAVLDGGLARWRDEGRPVFPRKGGVGRPAPREGSESEADGGPFEDIAFASGPPRAIERAELLASGLPVADARSAGRFAGTEPEPRAGIAAGHMPGARNLHYADLFRADGTYKRGDALRAAFAAAGINPVRPFVATCGSGVTAANLVFAARLLGNADVPLYDGSWAEWGADPSTPKATGPV